MSGRLLLIVITFAGTACAQFNAGSTAMPGRVRVQVVFANHGSCTPTTRVTLHANSGFVIADSFVNEQCVADFFEVPPGNYNARVDGPEIANADRSDFELSPGMTQEVDLRVRHKDEADAGHSFGGSAFVSAGELGVPSNAAKEFEKANRLISKQDWPKASERLQKAIAIYPKYAAAYNNLGAVYSHMGETVRAREALQKALTIDDRLPSAYANLARINFAAKDFPAVEGLIGRALSLAAPNTEELMLLAYSQLADRNFDQAVETSRQAHRSQLGHHASLHLVAASALDVQGKSNEALAEELRLFLSEEPDSARAAEVRKSLSALPLPSPGH